MKLLINTSNIKMGGALQVAHSFIFFLKSDANEFCIILSEELTKQVDKESFPENFIFYTYNKEQKIGSIFLGRDSFLDNIEHSFKPDRVFSVFGPTYWKPKAKHIVGYAKPHYVYKDSPFFNLLSFKNKLKLKLNEILHLYNFRNFCDEIITESEDVSEKLSMILKSKTIHTVTNYHHQIYSESNLWRKDISLPYFEGYTLLTISANYPHKNLNIIPEVLRSLKVLKPNLKFRFILTINKEELKLGEDFEYLDSIVYLDKVSVDNCPYLYEQSDFMFLPTLLECFSASYPEAMVMQKPILTSNLDFAKGICGDAAVYFDPINPEDIAEKIIELVNYEDKQNTLKTNGLLRLKEFDTSTERAQKIFRNYYQMKQIIQDLKQGHTILEEVPAPQVKAGQVLIQTSKTLVSLGTERMLVEFGKANYLDKARQQPDKVKMVLDKVKTDGLKPTIDSVLNKLNQPLPLGYCNVGTVVAIGKGVSEFKIGDRVASNGNHAEFVSIPKNLVAAIPEDVTDEQACFTVIGAIALQGIRLMKPTLGETIVVVGLGLIGLLTAELLKANGCKVIGFDYDASKVAMAREKGITAVNPGEGVDQVKFVEAFTNGVGADGVLITASNKSNEIISQSANMCRKRGRIVLIGVIGLDISRDDFYKKEISFQVSCSYGAGRYDAEYEDKGNDYPIAYVRWTQKRNFEAVLHAIASGQIEVDSLITERVKLEDYQEIYGDMKKAGSIASIMSYDTSKKHKSVVKITENNFAGNKGVVGIIGAGNFTSAMILPKLKNTPANLKYIASAGGLSGTTMAKRYNIAHSTTDYKEILKDTEVDLVLVTTRHHQHATIVVEALNAGKHVFVEKPLALNQQELDQVIAAYIENNKTVNLGFNRRFAPLAKKMKKLLGSEPMNIVATMNAGAITAEVWVHDMEVGGGRIIGEACHYIDLCSYLAGSKVKSVCMNAMGVNPNENTDNASIMLQYENGTNAVINYFANGSKAYAKERVEVFSQERVLVMDNWRKLKGYGFKGFSSASSGQDKGHANQFDLLIDRIQNGGDAIVPFDEIINTTKASFAAIESMQTKAWVDID